ncbi:MAG: dihydroorotate dehydrogenase electron transfer subunit [Synergistaceae bacterium]|nr:dihydroorotate dehydrogenase electron transfer subunit [Synergistaceae bacterium]
MREEIFTVSMNQQIAESIFRMELDGNTEGITAPGQFVNIQLQGHYLRRPISVCDWSDGKLTLIYKVVGSGTLDMSRLKIGARLSLLTGLGNGYDISDSENIHAQKLGAVIIGGGAGVPPLYGLAKRFAEKGVMPEVILGFNTERESFLCEEFADLGLNVKITTLDGSKGVKGLVTDVCDPQQYSYCCGPLPMLRAVYARVQDGQFSFEARMACGFGVCMGCSMKTRNGSKRICKDGPVLKHSEILFSEA